jgi:hypothetical protein
MMCMSQHQRRITGRLHQTGSPLWSVLLLGLFLGNAMIWYSS